MYVCKLQLFEFWNNWFNIIWYKMWKQILEVLNESYPWKHFLNNDNEL